MNRCAALQFYYDQIAILPFKQEVAGGVASTYIDEDLLKEINENQYERDSRYYCNNILIRIIYKYFIILINIMFFHFNFHVIIN